MKKILLLTVLGIAVVQMVNAQFIDVVGKGILNESSPTLTIPNMETVDKVVVEAAGIFEYGKIEPTVFPKKITFSSKINQIVPFIPVEDMKSPALTTVTNGTNTYYYNAIGDYLYYGYYAATFKKADINPGGIIRLNKNGQGDNIPTLFAYVYRTNGVVNKFSIISNPLNRAFLWINGTDDPLVRNFTLPAATGPRNIEVSVPLSDRNDIDDRVGVITMYSGTQQTDAKVFQLNGQGENFHLERLALNNIPMNVTDVKVEIYSPMGTIDGKRGDSFIVGLPVLTVTNVYKGCTLTQGYWKTHSKYGPAKPADPIWDIIGPDKIFYNSGQSYIKVLQTPPKGNKYYILAHQFIAAELNFLAGADNSTVEVEFQQAKSLFETYSSSFCAGLSKNECTEIENIFTKLAEKLDKYNNGIIGPGHCDEECDKDKDCDNDDDKDYYCKDDNDCDKDKDKDHKDKKSQNNINVQVNPNPVIKNATISFTPACDGHAVAELFDCMGNKKDRLFNQNVKKDSPVKFNFNGNQYRDGLYVIVFTNGSVHESVTIKINK